MYKDKNKQREADKERARRYRAKQKGVTIEGVTAKGVTDVPPDEVLFAGLPDALEIYANSEFGGDWYREMIYHIKTTPIEQLYSM